MARAFYRGYVTGGKRAGQVRRLHIIREHGPTGWEPGRQAWCGVAAWRCRASEPVILDPMPSAPPEGLLWCPACIGHLAEELGALGEVAERLSASAAVLVEHAPVASRPFLNGGALPDLAHVEHHLGRGEVVTSDELLDALPADAEHPADFCRADQVVHSANHSQHPTSRLTRGKRKTNTSQMTSAASAATTPAKPGGPKCK